MSQEKGLYQCQTNS